MRRLYDAIRAQKDTLFAHPLTRALPLMTEILTVSYDELTIAPENLAAELEEERKLLALEVEKSIKEHQAKIAIIESNGKMFPRISDEDERIINVEAKKAWDIHKSEIADLSDGLTVLDKVKILYDECVREEQQSLLISYQEKAVLLRQTKKIAIEKMKSLLEKAQNRNILEAADALIREGSVGESLLKKYAEWVRAEKKLKERRIELEQDYHYYSQCCDEKKDTIYSIQHKRVRELILAAIDQVLDLVSYKTIFSEKVLNLKKQLETMLLSLGNDEISRGVGFMQQIDRLTEYALDFIDSAEISEINIVQKLINELLPIVFSVNKLDLKKEKNPITFFRQMEENVSKIYLESKIKVVDQALSVLKEKLQDLRAKEGFHERENDNRENSEPEDAQKRARLEEEVIILRVKAHYKRKEYHVLFKTFREIEERYRNWLIRKIEIILLRIEESHRTRKENKKLITKEEILVIQDLRYCQQRLIAVQSDLEKDVEENLPELLWESRNIIIVAHDNMQCYRQIKTDADIPLFEAFQQYLESVSNNMNLYNFNALIIADEQWRQAKQDLKQLKLQQNMAEMELDSAIAMGKKPSQPVPRDLPKVARADFSLFASEVAVIRKTDFFIGRHALKQQQLDILINRKNALKENIKEFCESLSVYSKARENLESIKLSNILGLKLIKQQYCSNAKLGMRISEKDKGKRVQQEKDFNATFSKIQLMALEYDEDIDILNKNIIDAQALLSQIKESLRICQVEMALFDSDSESLDSATDSDMAYSDEESHTALASNSARFCGK